MKLQLKGLAAKRWGALLVLASAALVMADEAQDVEIAALRAQADEVARLLDAQQGAKELMSPECKAQLLTAVQKPRIETTTKDGVPIDHTDQPSMHVKQRSTVLGESWGVQQGSDRNVFETNAGTGGWGGTCTCGDGSTYQVGDQGDGCGSLACLGGTSGACNRWGGAWSGNKVTCGGGNIGEAGCYYFQPGGCPGKMSATPEWARDHWGESNANSAASKSDCEARKSGHDGWCGSTSSQWLFVSEEKAAHNLATAGLEYWKKTASWGANAGCVETNTDMAVDLKAVAQVDARMKWGDVSEVLCFTDQPKNTGRFNEDWIAGACLETVPGDSNSFTFKAGANYANGWDSKASQNGNCKGDYYGFGNQYCSGGYPVMPYGKCEMTLCFPLLSTSPTAATTFYKSESVSGSGWWLYGDGHWRANTFCGSGGWRALVGAEVQVKMLKLTRCIRGTDSNGNSKDDCKVTKDCKIDTGVDVKMKCRPNPGWDIAEKNVQFSVIDKDTDAVLMTKLENIVRYKCMSI